MKLYAPVEIEALHEEDAQYMAEIAQWTKEFLGKPHPMLGRPGPVCPFVPRALQLNTIRLTVVRTREMSQQQIEDLVKEHRKSFLELEAKQGELAFFKAIMIVFPDVSEEEAPMLIDQVQQNLKPFLLKRA